MPKSNDVDNYGVLPYQGANAEINQFARWFHQDWKLVFKDFPSGVALYVDNLSAERRVLLAGELRQFLDEHDGLSAEALRKKWLDLGAQAWPRGLDIWIELEAYRRLIVEGK
jgi:hypothetical protein